MLRPSDNWNELLFLASFLSGDISLIASFVVSRFHWRQDVPPYNLRTHSFDVLLHPAKYVQPRALRATRALQLLGALLLLVALLAIAREALPAFSL